MKKILVATEKPFAKVAVDGIRKVVEAAGYELVLLESYKSKAELLGAVANADAMIVRSDIVDREVVEAAKNLKIVVRAGAGYDNLDLAACTEKGIVAMKSGEVAEKAGIDKAEVDKIIKKLKKEEKIVSPKMCFYQAK